MRIRFRKYILNREQAESTLEQQEKDKEWLQMQLAAVADWADKSLNLHVPYFSERIDLSTSTNENRKKNLLDTLGRNAWCSECGSQWPCKKIDELKTVERIAKGWVNPDELQKARQGFENIKPQKHPNQLGGREFFL